MPSFSNFKTVNRIKFKIYNEKSLFFLLLVLSVITVFIVLMNLPTDIQTKKDIEQHNLKTIIVSHAGDGNFQLVASY